MQKLITIAELKDNTDINPGVGNVEISVNRLIDAAQLEDLRHVLGDKLFWDLIKNPTSVASGRDYVSLLAETEYTFDNITYTSPGVKKILFDYVYARYRYQNQEIDQPGGFATLDTPNMPRVSETRNVNIYTTWRRSAKANWDEVRNYLNRIQPQYTHWIGSESHLDRGEEKILINKATVS